MQQTSRKRSIIKNALLSSVIIGSAFAGYSLADDSMGIGDTDHKLMDAEECEKYQGSPDESVIVDSYEGTDLLGDYVMEIEEAQACENSILFGKLLEVTETKTYDQDGGKKFVGILSGGFASMITVPFMASTIGTYVDKPKSPSKEDLRASGIEPDELYEE